MPSIAYDICNEYHMAMLAVRILLLWVFFIQGFHPHCAIKNETSVLLIMNAEIKLQHHILDVDILGNITELPCYSYTFSL